MKEYFWVKTIKRPLLKFHGGLALPTLLCSSELWTQKTKRLKLGFYMAVAIYRLIGKKHNEIAAQKLDMPRTDINN
jgi:hypothetical protein